MADVPSRPEVDPDNDGDQAGGGDWTSPLPAEYGSLRPVRQKRSDGSAPAGRVRARRARPDTNPDGISDETDNPSVSGMLRRLQGGGEADTVDRPPARNRVSSATRAGSRTPRTSTAPAAAPAAAHPADQVAAPTSPSPGPAYAAADLDAATGVRPEARRSVQPGFDRTTSVRPLDVEDLTAPVRVPGPPLYDLEPQKLSRRERRAERKAHSLRSRATIRHLDIFTVFRVSLIFYLIVAAVVVVASLMLYYAAKTFGTLPSMEKSIKTLFDLKTFVIKPKKVAEYTALGGLILAGAGLLFNMLAALTYNLISDIVGGVRVEMESFPSD